MFFFEEGLINFFVVGDHGVYGAVFSHPVGGILGDGCLFFRVGNEFVDGVGEVFGVSRWDQASCNTVLNDFRDAVPPPSVGSEKSGAVSPTSMVMMGSLRD